ncbi:hypothetical protein K402DRAFT_396405 [Aulographum hederae CBS 113979]|uniref:TOM core complex subunit Tom6 n=1 Tax=Aulographum hederae CBS 113979 TaxID=1176131 RepID=A0A6G1GS86_9PEZI|nr:hypothetical protein K402DRAFT_396405 [Aulographum hederae CBS 113979]
MAQPRGGGYSLKGGKVQDSYVRSVYQALTSADNRTAVTAVGLFAAGVAFLSSSYSELLLPP